MARPPFDSAGAGVGTEADAADVGAAGAEAGTSHAGAVQTRLRCLGCSGPSSPWKRNRRRFRFGASRGTWITSATLPTGRTWHFEALQSAHVALSVRTWILIREALFVVSPSTW